MSDRSLIVAIVAVGVSLCGVILLTDDGAKIDALDARLNTRIDGLDAKIDGLDAKIDDIRVYIAAKHGERISFTPGQSGSQPSWKVHEVGTLEIRGGIERRAVLRIERNKLTREWAHLGNADTLDQARALTNMSLARAGGG